MNIPSDLAFLRSELKKKLKLTSSEGRTLEKRINTISSLIRLPLPSNRSCNKTPMIPRWDLRDSYLSADDPRYASEAECRRIELKLWAQLSEIIGESRLSSKAVAITLDVLGRPLSENGARCLRSNTPLTAEELVIAIKTSTYQVGSAELPIEYAVDLRKGGRHRANNIGWTRTANDRVILRQILARNGVPKKLLEKIQIKAYATDKVTMPPHFSNRDYRWATWVDSSQFASRTECQDIELELLAQVMEFADAPKLGDRERVSVEKHRGKRLNVGRRCPIIGTALNYSDFVVAVTDPKAGKSPYHVGHLIPLTRGGAHVRDNVIWMSERGNRIQGNDTFDEIVKIICSAAAFHGRDR